MRILGIDPGVARVGIGILERTLARDLRVLDWFTIETRPEAAFPERLKEICDDVREIIDVRAPDLAVLERLFFKSNRITALDVAASRGAILLTLAQCGIRVIEPTPLQLKVAVTGDGRADKRQVQDMLVRLLQLTERPKPDDAADALALALYGAMLGERRATVRN